MLRSQFEDQFQRMARHIHLRKGSAEHYAFAQCLYLSTMQPYAAELMVWDETLQRDSFADQWRLDEVQIIAVDGKDVGWLQVSETPMEIRLLQFFMAPDHQRQGIGTQVLNRLVATWQLTRKQIALTVLTNNPAKRLYERCGFSVVGEMGIKLEMKLYPHAPALGDD
jgi:GNAT superfamily N-acetyltransferase